MEYMAVAEGCVREAGAVLMERFRHSHRIDYKGEIDIVTEVDHLSEALIIRLIRESCPDHDILTEETGNERRESPYQWIVDPLDGTTNYAHGFPFFCVTVALAVMGDIMLGVIYDPLRDDLFTVEKGNGTFCNGEPLTVSSTSTLTDSLLATGFPYDIRVNPDNNINYFNEMAMKVRAIRRAGSAALDLAFVASGCVDGFWELKLHPWDTAAGWLMVEEAGGVVTDARGGAYALEAPHIVASNGRIHDMLISVLGETDPMDGRLRQ